MYSPSIDNIIKAFKKLPAVGQRAAERFVFHLLKSGKKEVGELTLALKELIDTVKSCEICWNFSDTSPCPICANTKRDQEVICVVTDPQDLAVIENTNEFRGTYHVLRGLVDPGNLESMEKIKIKQLITRINNTVTQEIILALNHDIAGETTMMYLEKEFKKMHPNIKISRLARGLPMGGDLRYADEITLGSAIKNRIVK